MQTLANLRGDLSTVAPVAANRAAKIGSAALSIRRRLPAALRTTCLLICLLVTFRTLLALLASSVLSLLVVLALALVSLLTLLPFLSFLPLEACLAFTVSE